MAQVLDVVELRGRLYTVRISPLGDVLINTRYQIPVRGFRGRTAYADRVADVNPDGALGRKIMRLVENRYAVTMQTIAADMAELVIDNARGQA